jgi:hypothetical protein
MTKRYSAGAIADYYDYTNLESSEDGKFVLFSDYEILLTAIREALIAIREGYTYNAQAQLECGLKNVGEKI